MNLPELCIRRPIAITLLMAGAVVFGLVAYRSLPVNELPSVDFPTIAVSVQFPGASPQTMASSVATPLENQFSTIAGLNSMNSTSALGLTTITLVFALERNIDGAAEDVQTAITAAAKQLPPNLPAPPTFKKVNPADFPIFYLALASPTLPLYEVDTYAETILAQRLSMVSGVAQVNVYGSQQYAVRVQVDPDALSSRNIGLDEVLNTVNAGNVNLPVGTIDGAHQSMTIQANGQLMSAKAYMNQIALWRNGAPILYKDLGQVLDSVQNNKVAGWYNGHRAIVLAIQRQPGSNTIAVVDAIKAVLPGFQAHLPASVDLNILYDRSESIRASVNDVQFTLLLAAGLVVMVIFLFLRNLSATIIPSLALPISVIGTFAVMYQLGYSLDNLSLLALTLSVGFVVDDAIVMLENIVRHMEAGLGPFEAALKGSREIGFTIISMTVSLAAVFIPVLFMGGIVGRLLHEFAVTICAAIFVSGIVSLTLTPMMCSRFVHAHGGTRHNWIYRQTERGFELLLDGYKRSLGWCLAWRPVMLIVFLGTLVATGYLFAVVPKDFLPSTDTGQIVAFTEGPQDASFDSMKAVQQQAAAVVREDPNIAQSMSFVGASGPRPTENTGTIFMRLKPRNERALNADHIIDELRPKLAGFPGLKVYLQNPPAIRVGGQLTKAQYQYTLQDIDLDELYATADKITSALRGEPGFLDVNTDMQIASPQLQVNIDRDRAAAVGVTAQQIESALGAAFSSEQISTIYTDLAQYWVILEVTPKYQADPNALSHIYIRSTNGSLVPLDAVVKITRGVGPLTINHLGQLPSVTVSFNLAPDVSLGTAVQRIQALERRITMPAAMSASFQGTAQAFQSSLQGMGILLVMAIVVVYIVLGVLYESFIHPFTILSGLPSAAVGALLTLYLFNTPLSLYAFVGIIMLVGIVKKNAIMMIDFALERQRHEGMSPPEAIYQACLIRFRPIMMTTMAALLGTLPIALGAGQGSEARRPLGLAVVGGLILSQLLTLYLTPVVYIYLDNLAGFLSWGRGRPHPSPEELAAAAAAEEMPALKKAEPRSAAQ